ncbi:MAG: cytidylate kinase-like family protein [Treponema sp.]|nr:cytidylate kinase-like family protein [Treponema sp.]
MDKQIIISISREYGSGGHEIGRKLAEKLEFEFFDRNLLDELSNIKGVDTNLLKKYDEKPRNPFFSRTVRGYTNSPEQNIAEMQFSLLKQKAADEDSFVILGRCSDEIFMGISDVLKIFIRGDLDTKVKRVMEKRGMDASEAVKTIERHDKKRKAYHDYFCHSKWGELSNYDLCIDSGKLGIDGTVDMLVDFIKNYLKKRDA